jgi:2-oxoglutarate dehydrogenase E1 component
LTPGAATKLGMRVLASTATSETELQRRLDRAPVEGVEEGLRSGAEGLIAAYRAHGFRAASIDPLNSAAVDYSSVAELDPRSHGVARDESARHAIVLGSVAQTLSLADLLSRLRSIYCGTIAIDCAHLRSGEQRGWLYTKFEQRYGASMLDEREALRVMRQLVAAEAFEHHHRTTYSKYKQFSLEGSESLVTLLRSVIERAAQLGVEGVVLGLPHRGRLNAMLNALDVPPKQLLSLFSPHPDTALAAWDLKDHAGLSTQLHTAHGDIDLLLAHNPSHLESVSPVVCGMARALQDRKAGSSKKVLPVLVHGDASFSGQGVVMETLNLSQTRGYGVGGTVHLILNNQIGSTVSHPRDSRSTLHCADTARAIDAPIVHVNADDPEAVLAAAELATDYRFQFGADVVVNHVGYRRFGHFVGDDPKLTQPAMQRRIERHRSVVDVYAERLRRRGLTGAVEPEGLRGEMFTALTESRPQAEPTPPRSTPPPMPESGPADTAVPLDQLRTYIQRLAVAPTDFCLHPKTQMMVEDWQAVVCEDEHPVDWRLAENLAYGTLLANGFNVRLSGLDVGRGTFVHRQHVWHDQAADIDWKTVHVPLRGVAEGQGVFSIFESPLSEEAVVGFEYGYTLQSGRDLVVWEAQFGDFVNNAQVIIDQYIATGESKWGYKSGLVLLLPHGYDGWGPEHSCAFLGRFLQLCAAGNIRVAIPSTPAQCFHLLRRQALTPERKPLIVMTPKPWFYGLQASYSRLRDLAQSGFQTVLGDPVSVAPASVSRAIVTSGKLYYDLVGARSRAGLLDVPVLRLEQLYPFPAAAIATELRRYPLLRETIWAQEEPRNHGAWHLLRDPLEAALPADVVLHYAGRPAAAPTAICDSEQHAAEQRAVVATALGVSLQ